LPENQISQEDCSCIDRSVADALELELVGSVLDIALVDKGERKQQEFEQLLGPSHNKAGSSSDSDSDNKPINNKVDSDDDNRQPRPIKQKRPSLSKDGLTSKKCKHHL